MKLDRDIGDAREAIEAAAHEHAERAVAGLLADLDLHLRHLRAEADPETDVRAWAACLLVRVLAQKIRR